ncbi:MAG TPA: hypothetical protein VHE81_03715 [Lacipirellulaceae bacterium]|nr:hypothetical protein [Lacipirellulaceae bacterium]
MDEDDRNTGVTEARFALTLLTCLLVAIGYILLLRLGGAKDSPVVIDPDDTPPPIAAGPESTAPSALQQQLPQVLPIDKPDDGSIESTAQRPKRTSTLHRSGKSARR